MDRQLRRMKRERNRMNEAKMSGESENRQAAEKKLLRKELLAAHNALSAVERLEGDKEILRLAVDMLPYRQALRLFVFVGTGWEADTRPLIREALAQGKQVAVPRCLPAGRMDACLIHSLDELRLVPPLGLWEPEAGTPVLPLRDVDFALVPCIACDTAGYRLGRGGGYYDRFLRDGAFVKAAVCRRVMLRKKLPAEAHDEKVDFIITEAGIIDCRDGL